jgi:pilus assembly protein TadC
MEDHPRFGSGQLVGQLGREMKVKLKVKLKAESSAEGLKLTANIVDVLNSMAQSMNRMADSLESLDSTTKEISKNVQAMAAKILES